MSKAKTTPQDRPIDPELMHTARMIAKLRLIDVAQRIGVPMVRYFRLESGQVSSLPEERAKLREALPLIAALEQRLALKD
jgi:hypothetical protein